MHLQSWIWRYPVILTNEYTELALCEDEPFQSQFELLDPDILQHTFVAIYDVFAQIVVLDYKTRIFQSILNVMLSSSL